MVHVLETTLERVREAYRSCGQYRDHGTVTHNGVRVGSFETSYQRAHDRFSFRYIDADTTAFALSVERGTITDFGVPDAFFRFLPNPPTLTQALAVLTGVTSGCVVMVPSLLLPQVLSARKPWLLAERAISMVDSGRGAGVVTLSLDDGNELDVNLANCTIVRHAIAPLLASAVIPDTLLRARAVQPELMLPEQITSYEVELLR